MFSPNASEVWIRHFSMRPAIGAAVAANMSWRCGRNSRKAAPVLSEAKLQIWTRCDAAATARWQLIQTLVIDHARRAAY